MPSEPLPTPASLSGVALPLLPGDASPQSAGAASLCPEEALALLQRPAVTIWGVPLQPLSFEQTVDVVDAWIATGREPGYFITANLNYVMLSNQQPELAEVNRRAAFLVADGMPLVWYSRVLGCRLPQRVAGSDLIYALCHRASRRGYRVFFLGGLPEVAEAAASRLVRLYPGLQLAGVESPPFRPLSAEENAALCRRIREAGTDLLLVAFGQPKGELWIHRNLDRLQVPMSVQLGASFDFVAGRVRRAPRWMQRCGLEWLHRVASDPRRLGPRMARNLLFLFTMLLRDAVKGPY